MHSPVKQSCIVCGYDMQGSRSARCPECGSTGTEKHRSVSYRIISQLVWSLVSRRMLTPCLFLIFVLVNFLTGAQAIVYPNVAGREFEIGWPVPFWRGSGNSFHVRLWPERLLMQNLCLLALAWLGFYVIMIILARAVCRRQRLAILSCGRKGHGER